MNTVLYKKIIEYLNSKKIDYSLTEHEPVYTSDQAAHISQHPPEEGAKSLALNAGERIGVVTVSGAERINFKGIQNALKTKKINMCNEEVIKKKLNTEIGGLAPFGYDKDVIIIVSKKLLTQKKVHINPGRNDATLMISGNDFNKIMADQKARIID